ncbi:MAG TPA: hypothetical protein VND65_00955, partial [Candidatus Binatia bacterium]|nr:hypothetical protein [Candidatus Binatia bacterium]
MSGMQVIAAGTRMRRFAKFIGVVLVAVCAMASCVYSQEIKGRRAAFGIERAEEVETLLHTLFPGSAVQWDPFLAIRRGGGPPEPVDLGNFTATREPDGSFYGVALLEVGSAKSDHIEKLKKFRASDAGKFQTSFVAFRSNSSGKDLEIKKVPLDPNDPLTRVTWFEVQKWPAGSWPTLRVHYESYIPGPDTLTVLEWDSGINMASGSFQARIPAGMSVLQKGGEETQSLFSVHRTGPSQVAIEDGSTGKTID